MSNEIDDLKEFNSKVAGGQPQARVRRRYNDETEVVGDGESEGGVESKDTRMWAVHGGRNYSPCETAVSDVPPGQYVINRSDSIGIYFARTDVNLDDIINLPDSVSEEVIEEIETFWKKEDHFRKFGFLWKRGVLMWGPPGSGKTSTLQVISNLVIQRGGVSVYVAHPGLAAAGLKLFRQIEPKRPLIVMLEDIDSIIDTYGESDLLALMDGELQIDNVVFVATTNYPERLDKRFINRPSRFDIVKKIGMPEEAAREMYLKAKCERLAKDENTEELATWVRLTKGFSIAHLKELIVSVEVFECELPDAVSRLRTMMDYSPKSSDGDDNKTLGFV